MVGRIHLQAIAGTVPPRRPARSAPGPWFARYDSTTRVLIVEDEPKSAAYLRKGLAEHGYVADVSGNGEDGLYLAQNSNYDLIILDIMLPQRDGWGVIRELRRVGKQTPVLFLTARDSVPDRVKGLDLCVDDVAINALLTSATQRPPAPAEGKGLPLPNPVFPQFPDRLNDPGHEVPREKLTWGLHDIYRTSRGWLFPYMRSRVMPGEFHPISATADCRKAWSAKRSLRGPRANRPIKSVGAG